MKIRPLIRIATVLLALVVSTSAASAGGISLFGSYLDLDAPDGVLGIGLRSDLSLGEHWTLDFTTSYHDRSEVTLDVDQVSVEVIDEVRFLPADLGLRYHFRNAPSFGVYLGGGYSYLRMESEIGKIDALHGFYGVVGVTFGDDIGPKLFVEGTARGYEDADVDLVEELDSDNRAEFAVDGFSVAFGVRWQVGR